MGLALIVKGFKFPKRSLRGLDAETAALLLGAASDVAIVADTTGTIRDTAIQDDALAAELEHRADWSGRKWIETVTLESRPKVESLLAQAGPPDAPLRWRHVNYPSAAGPDIPVLHSTIRLPGDNRVVVLGRDLRAVSELQQRLIDAQQAMERDHSRHQQMEMRYRILFQMSPEAVLIVDAATLRITEANPAAQSLLDEKPRRLYGRPLTEFFDPESGQAVQAMLAALRSLGRVDNIRARLAEGGRETDISARLFRQESEQLALVRLSTGGPDHLLAGHGPAAQLLDVVQNLPDGFVVTSAGGEVVAANAAFLAMAQLANEEQARGESLDRWLGRPGVDLNVLIANLHQRNNIRLFATTFRDEYGAVTEVEISAASVVHGEQTYLGFCIRNVGRRLASAASAVVAAGRALPRSVEQLTELIGRVSLKDLVREATDMIERLCIEAALEMTNDNRASAAELLGLSRQSLYVKLRRYGLGDLAEGESS